uniref:Tetratricopeptide repeat protein n=1 Tax=candidate division WOR-3 bacterium TaxID=2052148 RepID=A0A7C4TJP7_UNCW3
MEENRLNYILAKIRDLTEGYYGEDTPENRLAWLESLLKAYQKYLPSRVIDKIKVDPKAKRIEGERRNVTVLFADLSGFTALSETMDAEEIAGIINDFFTRMVKIVHKYEGSVDKFLGDALMVLFGAPVAHHDDPERAVRAGLEMLKEMERFNAEKKFASPLSMSIGINTGPAVALNVGSEERMEYTVIGDTVNLAARLESVSGPKEIIISNFTYDKIADIVDAEKRPPVKVKGKRKPVVNYLVKGIQERYRLPEITRIKFVGRESELKTIRDSFTQVKNNVLTIIGISGEPGSGKTRLGIESEVIAHQENFTTFSVRCVPYNLNIPYNSFIEFFNNYFEFKKDAKEEEKRLLMSLKLKSIGLPLDNILPYIGTLYGMEFPEVQSLPPDELKKRIFNAIKGILSNEAKRAPLFIRIEDLQWADPTSIEVLEYLLKELKDSAILFLFEYRPDYAFPYLGFENCKNILLKNFTKEETQNLIKFILEGEQFAPEIGDFVYEKSIGNPLFATEILKMLMIKNGIRKTRDGFVPTERFKKLEVAESISSVILDQIDRMNEMDRRILQYASVLGRDFEPELLSQILKIPQENLSNDLQRLEHFEGVLVFDPANNKYGFTSPTTYEVVYGSLLKAKRKELHTIIGNELEKIPEEKIFENLEKLAYHFSRSNDERKGVFYLKSSADKSYRLYALKEAIGFFNQALELLHKKELTEDELQDKLEILRRQGWVLRLTGDLENAILCQKRSLRLASKLESLKDIAGANLNIGIIYQEMGIPKKGLNYWTRARRIAKKIGDMNILTLAVNNLGNYYFQIGNLEKAFEYFTESVSLAEKIQDNRGIGLAFLNLGGVIERKGDFQKALEYYKKAYENFEKIGDLENVARTLNQLGLTLLYSGNPNEAIAKLGEAANLAGEIGDKIMESLAVGNVGLVYAQMWQLNEAYEKFSQSLTIAQLIGEIKQQMGMNINLGDIHLFQGNVNQAFKYHNKAIELAIQTQDPFNEALARRSLGLDFYYVSENKRALEEFEKSQNMFQNIGDRRNSVISMLGQGVVRVKLGFIEEVEGLANDIEQKARAMNDLEILALTLDLKADLLITRRDYEGAKRILEELPDLSRQIGNKRLFAWAMAKLGEVQVKLGLLNEGEKNLEKSLAIAKELGDRILEAYNYLINTEIFIKKSDYTNALNILTKAGELTNQCGARELNCRSLLLTNEIYKKLDKNRQAETYLMEAKRVLDEITRDHTEEEKERYLSTQFPGVKF